MRLGWFRRVIAGAGPHSPIGGETPEALDPSCNRGEDATPGDFDRWLEADLIRLAEKGIADSGSSLDELAARLEKTGREEAAFRCRTRAIELAADGGREAGTDAPWLADFVWKQQLEAARTADRLAGHFRESDDEAALTWWRRSAELVGKLAESNDGTDPDVSFLQQKVLGEAAVASYRLAAAANDNDDAARSVEFWDQAARLAGRLLNNYPRQPYWVTELHASSLRSAATVGHKIAREFAGDSETAARHWQRSLRMFGQLLDRYDDQPEWVMNLHETALRDGGIACRDVARQCGDDLVKTAYFWDTAVGLFDSLLRLYPGQPPWVQKVYAIALLRGGVAYHDAAVAAVDLEPSADSSHLWQRSSTLLTALSELEPDQPAWVEKRIVRARTSAEWAKLAD